MEEVETGNGLWRAAVETMFLADSPVGKAVLDRDLRYVRINQTLAAFNGRSVEFHLGRTVQEVLPEAYPSLKPLLDQVIFEGRAAERFRSGLVGRRRAAAVRHPWHAPLGGVSR